MQGFSLHYLSQNFCNLLLIFFKFYTGPQCIFFQVEMIQNMSAAEEDDSMFLKSDLQNNPIIATLVLSE